MALIQLLSKHQLYISESGLIARYGKTKTSSESSSAQTHRTRLLPRMKEFLHKNMSCLGWFLFYVVVNLVLFAAGVGVYSEREDLSDSWRLWAFGTGPVLSMNCVLILLPTLSSLLHAMSNSRWMSSVSWKRECSASLAIRTPFAAEKDTCSDKAIPI